jgi:hypothetical protein
VIPSDESLRVIVDQLLADRAAFGSSFLLELECPECKQKFLKNTSSLLICNCGHDAHRDA